MNKPKTTVVAALALASLCMTSGVEAQQQQPAQQPARIPRAGPTAAVARPTCGAPAATGCSIASSPSRAERNSGQQAAALSAFCQKDHCPLTAHNDGIGLSQRDVPEISFERLVGDLESVVDRAGLERFILVGAGNAGYNQSLRQFGTSP